MPNKQFNFRFKKRKEPSVQTHTEPPRRNALDNVLDNLKASGRAISLHRVIYIAEHSFPHPEVSRVMRQIVEKENSEYCDELLTGFFLFYPKYFCHVIEASEQTLKRHINVVLTHPEFMARIIRGKLLIAHYHINQRMLFSWIQHAGKAPTLLEKITQEADLTVTMASVRRCVLKLYRLGIALRPLDSQEKMSYEDSMSDIDRPRYSEPEEFSSQSVANSFPLVLTSVLSKVSELDLSRKIGELLPESQLLDFLLKSPHLTDINSFRKHCNLIPSANLYRDLVAPVLKNFIPRDTFSTEFNPITQFVHAEEEQDTDNASMQ